MQMQEQFRQLIEQLARAYDLPAVESVFLPRLHAGGQPQDAEFMALKLEGGSAGVSYVLLEEHYRERYDALGRESLAGRSPVDLAREFGSSDPVRNMLGLAALNALCQHVMRTTGYPLDVATDSLGLLDIGAGDRIGMVGLFARLVPRIQAAGAGYVVIELNPRLVAQYPEYHITLDPTELRACNKVLCTSITVFNNTLDTILRHCDPAALVSIVGPTAGYFPDPLFGLGVDVVGGTYIHDGDLFMELIASGERWGPATRKFCFQKSTYTGLPAQ